MGTRTKRDPEREETDRKMRDLHLKDHLTLQEIGDLYGITRERVRQRINRAGVTREELREAHWYTRRGRTVAKAALHCAWCGTRKEVVPSAARRKNQTFCNRECRRSFITEKLLLVLRWLAIRLGYTPGVRDLVGHQGTCHTSFYTVFGDLPRAQELAGLTPNRIGGGAGPMTLPPDFVERWSWLAEVRLEEIKADPAAFAILPLPPGLEGTPPPKGSPDQAGATVPQ